MAQQQHQQHQFRHRPDGRPESGFTLRPLSCELSLLSKADGSAMLSCGSNGGTRILAAVYGPIAPRHSYRERMEEAMVSVVFKHGKAANAASTPATTATAASTTTSSLAVTNASTTTTTTISKNTRSSSSSSSYSSYYSTHGTSDREMERFISDVLSGYIQTKLYPRCIIQIVIQIIRSNGSIISTALNAATLALLDSGCIDMIAIPTAITFVCYHFNNNDNDADEKTGGGGGGSGFKLRLDPVAEEEQDPDSSIAVLATTNRNDNNDEDSILASMTFGQMSLESLLACVHGTSKASAAIVAFMRLVIEQKVTRESQTLWSH